MAKRRGYPSVLLKTSAAQGSATAYSRCLDALAQHYNLPVPFEKEGLPPPEMAKRWELLAMSMAVDVFPAFQDRSEAGAPSRVKRSSIWPHAHEARLVEWVIALESRPNSNAQKLTRMAAFGEIIALLKRNPAPHWKYGRYTKAASLAQAWKLVPDSVKLAPAAFIPTTGEGQSYRAREARAVAGQLPPVQLPNKR